jgi:hypothetical protein
MTPPGRVAAAPALLAVAPLDRHSPGRRDTRTALSPAATQRQAALNSSHHATYALYHRGAARVPAVQATQVVSHGRHHHNRLSVVSEPSSSGLNARGASPQNRHSGPPARASIHPVVLAVAACIPSSLGLLSTFVLHVGLVCLMGSGPSATLGLTDRIQLRLRRRCYLVTGALRRATFQVVCSAWQRWTPA